MHLKNWLLFQTLQVWFGTDNFLPVKFDFLSVSAGNVLGQVGPAIWSILGQSNCLNSEDEDGIGTTGQNQLDRTVGCRVGSEATWIL